MVSRLSLLYPLTFVFFFHNFPLLYLHIYKVTLGMDLPKQWKKVFHLHIFGPVHSPALYTMAMST